MVDTKFINPFIVGAVEALKITGGLTVEGGKPFLKGHQAMARVPIAGQLGLLSKTFKGAITICFEEKVFLKMLSNMFGEDVTEITRENQDGAAEILNIIYGHAKTTLNKEGYEFDRALPTVVYGEDLKTSHGKLSTLVIPLKTDFGFVYLEICVESK